MINRLVKEISDKQSPIVVGLDPTLSLLPKYLLEDMCITKNTKRVGIGEVIFHFNKEIIDNICDLVPAVKPQIGMYEQFGIEGLEAYIKTIQYAKAMNLIVIGDIKRGDIASTARAYATAHLGHIQIQDQSFRAFDTDFVTLNPYLGFDSIEPFIDVCREEKKGMFLLVKTSNKSSGDFQDLRVGDQYLYEIVGQKVQEWGELLQGEQFSYIGAVVGATYRVVGRNLRKSMPKTFFLVPGYGAQGGTAEDLAHYFDANGQGVIVNSSRGICGAYQNPVYGFSEKEFGKAARAAVIEMRESLLGVLNG